MLLIWTPRAEQILPCNPRHATAAWGAVAYGKKKHASWSVNIWIDRPKHSSRSFKHCAYEVLIYLFTNLVPLPAFFFEDPVNLPRSYHRQWNWLWVARSQESQQLDGWQMGQHNTSYPPQSFQLLAWGICKPPRSRIRYFNDPNSLHMCGLDGSTTSKSW